MGLLTWCKRQSDSCWHKWMWSARRPNDDFPDRLRWFSKFCIVQQVQNGDNCCHAWSPKSSLLPPLPTKRSVKCVWLLKLGNHLQSFFNDKNPAFYQKLFFWHWEFLTTRDFPSLTLSGLVGVISTSYPPLTAFFRTSGICTIEDYLTIEWVPSLYPWCSPPISPCISKMVAIVRSVFCW